MHRACPWLAPAPMRLLVAWNPPQMGDQCPRTGRPDTPVASVELAKMGPDAPVQGQQPLAELPTLGFNAWPRIAGHGDTGKQSGRVNVGDDK